MLDPILRTAFVELLILVFRYVFIALGVEVPDNILAAIAVAVAAWILGNPAGSATAQAITIYRSK